MLSFRRATSRYSTLPKSNNQTRALSAAPLVRALSAAERRASYGVKEWHYVAIMIKARENNLSCPGGGGACIENLVQRHGIAYVEP